MQISGYSIFFIFSIIHLLFCFFENEEGRRKTKCLILLSLMMVVAFLGVTQIEIYCALLFGLIGDFLLLNKKNKNFFIAGLIAFAFNHIFYIQSIIVSLHLFSSLYSLFIVLIVVIIFIISFIVGFKILPKHKIEASFYASLLATEIMFCIIFLIKTFSSYSLSFLPLIGIIFFSISDGYICKTMFFSHDKREDFYIMITYIIGQALISIGLGLF